MIDFSKVFPRLKETYDADSADPANILSYDDRPVIVPFAENLVISYALDKGSHYEYILNRDLSDDVTIEKLHQESLQNMIDEIADNIQAHGEKDDALLLTNGGNYEATMLLWDDIWQKIESVVEGDFYVAVPARDVLYVSPKSNPNAIPRLKELINKLFNDEEAQGLMVKHIYQRGVNGWEVVATA